MAPVSELLRCVEEDEREHALDLAEAAVGRGSLIVLPTDTVYGVGVDAFDDAAVSRLLRAKGRGRDMPPPVLVSSQVTLEAITTGLPDFAADLVDSCWPGPLTLVCRAQPSLHWDLGDSRGTVAVRMPDHEVALALLERTGPLAVSSANRSGQPPAITAVEAREMLAEAVEVYLDAGPLRSREPSTILDLTGELPRVLRQGALDLGELRDRVPGMGSVQPGA
jgi:L-threonylcarbamoyladenylate synthase